MTEERPKDGQGGLPGVGDQQAGPGGLTPPKSGSTTSAGGTGQQPPAAEPGLGGVLPARDWPEDKRKVHAEITQLVNQRFLLTSGAVGVVALFVGRVAPDLIQGKPEMVNALPVLSLGIVILVWILFEQSHWLRGMLRSLSTYLIVKKWSEFEADWQRFRLGGDDSNRGGQTRDFQRDPAPDIRSHSLVFYALILVTTGGPFLLQLLGRDSSGNPGMVEFRDGGIWTSFEVWLLVLGGGLCVRVWRVSGARYWEEREFALLRWWTRILDQSRSTNQPDPNGRDLRARR